MISPYEVAFPSYRIIEQSIDAYLNSHDWQSGGCVVPIQVGWPALLLENLIERYEDLGWQVNLVDEGNVQPHYIFEPPTI